MLKPIIATYLENGFKHYLVKKGVENSAEITLGLERPGNLEHGDYSTSAAMRLAKVLRQPPLQIAQEIKAVLEAEFPAHPLVHKLEVAAPGYLNVYIDWPGWMQQENREKTETFEDREKVVIEHTSINPNKSAHIGHLRNACIGDTLVRMLRRSGSNVEVHNYIDDLGNQLADTVVGLLHLPVSGSYARFGDFCWEVYSRLHQQSGGEPKLQEQRSAVLHELEKGTGNTAWLGTITAERIVREHLEEMAAFGITYDLLVWESSIVREGFWEAAFERLKQIPGFELVTSGKLAGCWVLRQTGHKEGLEGKEEEEGELSLSLDADLQETYAKDKVLVRSNGILTYTAKDIAYHLWKFGLLDKSFHYSPFAEGIQTTSTSGTAGAYGIADRVINVIDQRQEYPQSMVKQALEQLGYPHQAEHLQHVGYGVVSLSRASAEELGVDVSDGKSAYAMSGRQGIGMKIADLISRMERVIDETRPDPGGLSSRQIAAAAIRYYLLRYQLQTEVIFDIKSATEITGNTGVYLLYAYSRSIGVLTKGGYKPEEALPLPDQMPQLEKAEHALLRQIAAWPDLLASACRSLEPHLLCGYAYELCALFNQFYTACPVMKAEGGQKTFRFWLVSRFNHTLKDVLETIGLPAPSRM